MAFKIDVISGTTFHSLWSYQWATTPTDDQIAEVTINGEGSLNLFRYKVDVYKAISYLSKESLASSCKMVSGITVIKSN